MIQRRTVAVVLASTVIYVFFCAILFVVTPFMVSWGDDKNWFFQFLFFAQGFPFDLVRSSGDIMPGLIFVNALFWTICIEIGLFIGWVIRDQVSKRRVA